MIFFRDKKWNQTLRQIGERLGCTLIVVSFLLESIHPVFAARPLRRTGLLGREREGSVTSIRDEDLDTEVDFDSELSFASTTPPQREFARTQASTEILPLIVERYRRQLEQSRKKAQAAQAKEEELKRLNALIASAQYYERTLREKKGEVDRFQAYADYCGNQYRGAQGREDELAQAARKLHGVLRSTPQKTSKAKQEELPLSPQAAESYAELAKAYAKKAKSDHPNISSYAEAFSKKAQVYAAVLRDRSISGDTNRLRIIQNQLVRAHEELLAQWKIQVPQKRKQDGPKGPRKAGGLVTGGSDVDSALGSRSGQSRGGSGGVDAKGAQARDKKLKKQLAASGEQIRKLRVRHRELGERLRVSNDLLRFNQGKERDLSQRLDEKAALVEVLRAQAQALAKEQDQIRKERDAAVGGAAEKQRQLAALTSQTEGLRAQMATEAAARAQLESEHRDVSARLKDATAHHAELEKGYIANQTRLTGELEAAQREVQRLSGVNEAVGQERDQLKEANRDLTERASREKAERDAVIAQQKVAIDAGLAELQKTKEALAASDAGKSELTKQLDQAREQLRAATDELGVSRRRVSDLEATEQAVMKEARGLRESIGNLQQSSSEALRLSRADKDEALRRVAELEGEARSIGAEKVQLLGRNSALEQLTTQQRVKLEKLAAELTIQTARGARVEELTAAQDASLAKIRALQGEIDNLQPQLENLARANESLISRADAAEASAANLTAELIGSTKDLEKEKAKVAQLEQSTAALQAKAEAVEAERTALAAEKLRLEQAQGELKRKGAIKGLQIVRLQSILKKGNSDLEKSQARIAALTAEKERMSSQNADRVQGLEAQIREVQARADRLNREKSQTAGDLQAEQRKFQDLETKSKELEARNREVLLQSKQRAEEVKGLQAQLSAAILNNSRLIARSNSQASHISGLDAKLSAANRELADTAAKLKASEGASRRESEAAAQRERELSAQHQTLVGQMAAATKLIAAKDELLTQAGRVQEELEEKQKILQIKLLLLRKSSGLDSALKTKEIEEVRAALEASQSAVAEGKLRTQDLQSELADARRATAEVEARLAGEIETSSRTAAEQQRLLEEEKARLAALTTKIRDELDPELKRLRAGNEQLTRDLAVQEQEHAREIERLSAAHSAAISAEQERSAEVLGKTKAEAQAQIDVFAAKNTKLLAKVESVSREMGAVSARNLELERNQADLSRRLAARSQRVVSLVKNLAGRTQDLEEAQARIRELDTEKSRLAADKRAEAQALQAQIAEEKARVVALTTAQGTLDQDLVAARADIQRLEATAKAEKEKAASHAVLVFRKAEELNALEAQLSEAQAESEKVSAALQRTSYANDGLNRKVAEMKAQLLAAAKRWDASERARSTAETEANRREADLTAKHAALLKDIEAAQARIAEKDKALAQQQTLQLQIEGKKAQLEAELVQLRSSTTSDQEANRAVIERIERERSQLDKTLRERDAALGSLQQELALAKKETTSVLGFLAGERKKGEESYVANLELSRLLEKKAVELTQLQARIDRTTPQLEELQAKNAKLTEHLREQALAHQRKIVEMTAAHGSALQAEQARSAEALTLNQAEAHARAEEAAREHAAALEELRKEHESAQKKMALRVISTGLHIGRAKKEIEAIRTQLAGAEAERALSVHERSELVARARVLEEQLQAEKEEKERLTAESQQNATTIRILRQRLTLDQNARAAAIGSKTAALSKQILELREENSSEKRFRAEANTALQAAQQSLGRLQDLNRGLESEKEVLKARELGLRAEIEKLRSEAGEKDRAHQSRIEELERKHKGATERVEELNRLLGANAIQFNEQQARVKALEVSNRTLQEETIRAKESQAETTANVARLENELKKAHESAGVSVGMISGLQQQLAAALEKAHAAERAAQELEAKHTEELRGIAAKSKEALAQSQEALRGAEARNATLQGMADQQSRRADGLEAQIRMNRTEIERLKKEKGEAASAALKERERLERQNGELVVEWDAANRRAVELAEAKRAADQASSEALLARDASKAQLAAQAEEHALKLEEAARKVASLEGARELALQQAAKNEASLQIKNLELTQLKKTQAAIQAELDRLIRLGRPQDSKEIERLQGLLGQSTALEADISRQVQGLTQENTQLREEVAELEARLQKREAEFAEENRVLTDQVAQLQIQNQDLSARLAAETAAKSRAQKTAANALLQKAITERIAKKRSAAQVNMILGAHTTELAARNATREREIEAEVQRRLATMRVDLERERERERAEFLARQEELVATAAAARAKASSQSVRELMNRALHLLSGVLTPEQITKFSTKGFVDFKREILDPVCKLSASKSDRDEFFRSSINGRLEEEQLSVLNDTCIPALLFKYTNPSGKYGSISHEDIKKKRRESFAKKLKDGKVKDSHAFIDSFLEDEFRAVACDANITSPFLAIESLNQKIHEIKNATAAAVPEQLLIASALNQSIDSISKEFKTYPYTRLNRNSNCEEIAGVAKELSAEQHQANLNHLRHPVVVKQIQKLKAKCPNTNGSLNRIESSLDVPVVGSSPIPLSFILYCGKEDGQDPFVYLVPTTIGKYNYYVGTGGTLKDHYWGLRVDGGSDGDKSFIYRHVRPQGNLCREDGNRDAATFDKTPEEINNEELIESEAYRVIGKSLNRKGVGLEQKAMGQHRYEMLEYLGVDLNSYKLPLSDAEKSKCSDDLLRQVKLLHKNLILSRDIKPQNVLFKPANAMTGKPAECTLIDFGAGIMIAKKVGGKQELISGGLNFTDQYSPIDLAPGVSSQYRKAVVQENLNNFRKYEKTMSNADVSVKGFNDLSKLFAEYVDEPRFVTPAMDLYQTGALLAELAVRGDPNNTNDLLKKLQELKTKGGAPKVVATKINEIKTILNKSGVDQKLSNKISMLLFVLDQKQPNKAELADRSQLVTLANLCLYVDDHYCQFWNPLLGPGGGVTYLNVEPNNSVQVRWDLIKKHDNDREDLKNRNTAGALIDAAKAGLH